MADDFNIDGIFEHVTPEDFLRVSSARHVATMQQQSFDDFVTSSLETTRFAYHAADGDLCPVALLVGPGGRRIYAPDDDETLGQYLKRLHREARQHATHTLFTVWLTQGGTYKGDVPERVNGPEALQHAEKANGGLQQVIYWYAQSYSEIRHGIITIDDQGNTGEVIEAPDHTASHLYKEILGG